MAMVKATFLLPVHDNDGRVLRSGIREIEDALVFALGGYTRTKWLGGANDPAAAAMVKEQYLEYRLWIDEDKLEQLMEILGAFEAGTPQQLQCFYVDCGGYMNFL